jgi:hypothetical protein
MSNFIILCGLYSLGLIIFSTAAYLQARGQGEAWRRIAEERRWNAEQQRTATSDRWPSYFDLKK